MDATQMQIVLAPQHNGACMVQVRSITMAGPEAADTMQSDRGLGREYLQGGLLVATGGGPARP